MAAVRVDVFGGVRATVDGLTVDTPGLRAELLLSLLTLARYEPVSVQELTAWLWGSEPPVSAVNQVQRLVGQLRRMFEPGLATRNSGRVILAGGEGYRLAPDVSGDLFDLPEQLGASRLSGTGYDEVLRLLARQPFAGLDRMLADHPWSVALERERIAVAIEALTTVTRTGGATDLVDLAEAIASKFPFEEALQAQLILALAQVGRRSDALQRYDRIRRDLRTELGVDPGAELQAAQQRVLAAEADSTTISGPAQLPMVVGGLVERPEARQVLDRIAQDGIAGAVVVTAIGGMGGIGKTALAVAWAHELAPRFPDGQLYLNLRGFGPHTDVLTPEDAITSLLASLGAAGGDVATDLEARAAHLRSVLAGRRYLLLLDNARDAEQVRPLLPGDPGCLALVTSRNRLSSLVVREGAIAVHLDRMSADQARRLLEHRLGRAAVSADPRATESIVRACDGLPLALAIVATRVALQPELTLADVAQELSRSELTRWSEEGGPEDLSAVFAWSYEAVSARARRAFRLLGAHPAAELSLASVASLLGGGVAETRADLSELCNANLLQLTSADRFAMHDLLRAYSRQLLDAGERDAAELRIVDHYVQSLRNLADAAGRTHPRPRRPVRPGVQPVNVAGYDDSILWYETERESLQSAIRLCLERGQVQDAADLSLDCRPVSLVMSSPREGADAIESILAAADDSGVIGGSISDSTRADLHRGLGICLMQIGNRDQAQDHLSRAIELAISCGDLVTLCAATRNLGLLHWLRGEIDEAARLYDEALDQARQLRSEHLQVGILSELAAFYYGLERWEACLDACDSSLAIAEPHQWLHFVQVNHLNRAHALVSLRRFEEALAAIGQARHSGLPEPAYALSLTMLEAVSARGIGLTDLAADAVRRYREIRSNPVSDDWDYVFVDGLIGLDSQVEAVSEALAAETAAER